MRKALLIVRAGDRSQHPGWLSGRGASRRRFDLHISYFGDEAQPFADRPADVTLSREKGGKWTGIDQCLTGLGDRVLQYDWIGFPDDDLAADCRTWNRFFEILDELKPQLAQPALHWRSFTTYDLIVQKIGVKARWTNFVEIMAPVMSRAFFQRVRPTLGFSASGFGFDFWWPTIVEPRERSLLVVDETPVLHTRKFGTGSLYKVIKETGRTAMDERDAFFAEYGGEEYKPGVYSLVLPNGRERAATVTDHKRNYLSKKIRKYRDWRGVTQGG